MAEKDPIVKAAKDSKLDASYVEVLRGLDLTSPVDIVSFEGEKYVGAKIDAAGFITFLQTKDATLPAQLSAMTKFLMLMKKAAEFEVTALVAGLAPGGATAGDGKDGRAVEAAAREKYRVLEDRARIIIEEPQRLAGATLSKLHAGFQGDTIYLPAEAKKLNVPPLTQMAAETRVLLDRDSHMELRLQSEAEVPLTHVVEVQLAVHRMCLAICAAGQDEAPGAAAASSTGFIRSGPAGNDVCLGASYAEMQLLEVDMLAAARCKSQPSNTSLIHKPPVQG